MPAKTQRERIEHLERQLDNVVILCLILARIALRGGSAIRKDTEQFDGVLRDVIAALENDDDEALRAAHERLERLMTRDEKTGAPR